MPNYRKDGDNGEAVLLLILCVVFGLPLAIGVITIHFFGVPGLFALAKWLFFILMIITGILSWGH